MKKDDYWFSNYVALFPLNWKGWLFSLVAFSAIGGCAVGMVRGYSFAAFVPKAVWIGLFVIGIVAFIAIASKKEKPRSPRQ